MRAGRAGLTLVYILATLLAQGVHEHGEAPATPESHHGSGCDDPRLHLSGHPSSPSHEVAPDCLACQYRSASHFWLLTLSSTSRPCPAGSIAPPPPSARPGSTRPASSRAPPRA